MATPILAFTVDCEGTRNYEDAVSVTKCNVHKECNKIGYHITAVKNTDRIKQLPEYHANVKTFIKGRLKIKVDSLVKGIPEYETVSVYLHTTTSLPEGAKTIELDKPVIDRVKITENYTTGLEFEKTQEFQTLWNHLRREMLDGEVFFHFALHKEKGKSGSIISALAKMYSERIRQFLQNCGNCCYISKCYGQLDATQGDKVYVLADTVKGGQNVEDSGLNIISSFKYLLQPPCLSPTHPDNRRWMRRVTDCKKPQPESNEVWLPVCTSPARNVQDFVNQQILVGEINGNRVAYSREDLFGILCIRHSTPVKTRAVVGLLTSEKFNVSYVEVRHADHSIKQIFYSQLGGSSYKHNESESSTVVEWKDLPPPDQQGDISRKSWEVDSVRVIETTNETIEKLKAGWLKVIDGGDDTAFEEAREEIRSSTPQDCLRINNGRLELELLPRTLIRLQIAVNEARFHGGLGLRMLLIGSNCNICLAHAIDPVKVFMSDRHDLQDLLSAPRIEKLKVSDKKKQAFQTVLNDLKRETESNDSSEIDVQAVREYLMSKLEADAKEEAEARKMPQVISVEIIWEGNYNGEGTFETEISLSEGDLLCIRKDLDDYVWNAHAVVLGKKCDKVKFAVCSLSQTDSEKNGEFVIEILHI